MTALLPPPGRDYLVAALANTPATLAALLARLPAGDPAWDARPFPDRFRLREIVAHLADWDAVWQERFEHTSTAGEEAPPPLLGRPDPDRRAEEKGYAVADPAERLAHFRERRAALTHWLRSLPEDAWSHVAHRDRLGDISLAGLATLALGHDSYHLRQAAEWLALI